MNFDYNLAFCVTYWIGLIALLTWQDVSIGRAARAEGYKSNEEALDAWALQIQANKARSLSMRAAAKAVSQAHLDLQAKLQGEVQLNGAWAAELAIEPDSDLDCQIVIPGLDDWADDTILACIAEVEALTGFTFSKLLWQWNQDGSNSAGYKLDGLSVVGEYTFPAELVIRNEKGLAPAQIALLVTTAAERDAIRDAKREARMQGPKAYKQFKRSLDQALLIQWACYQGAQ